MNELQFSQPPIRIQQDLQFSIHTEESMREDSGKVENRHGPEVVRPDVLKFHSTGHQRGRHQGIERPDEENTRSSKQQDDLLVGRSKQQAGHLTDVSKHLGGQLFRVSNQQGEPFLGVSNQQSEHFLSVRNQQSEPFLSVSNQKSQHFLGVSNQQSGHLLVGENQGDPLVEGSLSLAGGKLQGTPLLADGKLKCSPLLASGKLQGSPFLADGKSQGSPVLADGKIQGSPLVADGKPQIDFIPAGETDLGIKNNDTGKIKKKMKKRSIKLLTCPECGKRFATLQGLSKHVDYHGSNQWQFCQFCDRRFQNAEARDAHQQRHISERSFGCGECGRRASRRDNMFLHMRTHAGSETFVCTGCNTMFKCADIYHSHQCHQQQQRCLALLVPPPPHSPCLGAGPTADVLTPVTRGGEENSRSAKADAAIVGGGDLQRSESSASSCSASAEMLEQAQDTRHSRSPLLAQLTADKLQPCRVRLTKLSSAVVAASPLTGRPVASFAATAGVGSFYPCYFCPGAVFPSKGNLVAHYTCTHFRQQFLLHYTAEQGPPLSCRLCGDVSSKIRRFCYHVGIFHGKLKELLPLEAYKALGEYISN